MQEQQLASSSSTKLQQQDEAAKQPARQSGRVLLSVCAKVC